MEFSAPRTVRSRTGLSQEQALASLQENPQWVPGTRISSFKDRNTPQGRIWEAQIAVPKLAGDNPFASDEEKDEPVTPDDSGDSPDGPADESSDSELDGPPKPEGDKKDDKGSEKAEIAALTDLVSQIAEHLGIPTPGPDDGLGGDLDGPPLDGPSDGPPGGDIGAPPMDGPPPGGPDGPPHEHPKVKLKPGETPIGGTPLGAPAFSSTRPRSFVASTDKKMTVKQAKTELETAYPAYQVKQAKRDPDTGNLVAVMSVR